jgi:UDPglucose--hexose-1-phosphate uridylyltransferase
VRTGAGSAGAPGWRVRVFPNRYPVVGPDGIGGATGSCEVVVFSPVHHAGLEDLDDSYVAELLTVIRDRVAVQSRAGHPSIQVFVNNSGASGASIAHPHAQLIALDFVPPALRLEYELLTRHGSDTLDLDLRDALARDLIILDGDIVAWCPWAMPEPFGVRIASRNHGPAFRDLGAGTVGVLAATLRRVARAVVDVLDHPPYNVVLYVDANRDGVARRWRVEVVPRLTVGGGFERGTGVTTNATDPCFAAEALRCAESAPTNSGGDPRRFPKR